MAKNTIRNSLEKVDEYLKQKREFVSVTQISLDLKLNYNSVKKCLKTLEKMDRITIATNNQTTLVKFKEATK